MIPKNIPYWLDIEYIPRTQLIGNIKTDVAIIGGGITGVSAAYHCAKSGLRTVLIEKDTIAWGSAGRNGGMVVEGLEIDFHEAIDEFGLTEAKDLWLNTVEARQYIASLIEEHNIDCDFSQPGSLYASVDEEGLGKLRIEAEARKAAGMSCEIIPRGTQFKDGVLSDALFNPGDCLLHPAKFVRALAAISENYGAVIYEATPALKFSANEIITPAGRITAGKVVLAMESSNPSPLSNQGSNIIRSQAIVTKPLSHKNLANMDWRIGGMLWPTGGDYLSCRKIGDRIFSCKSLPMEATPREVEENINKQINTLQRFFPSLIDLEVSHQWTGLMVETNTRRSYIKERDGIYEVGGHGGNGLTNGVMTGKHLAGSFLGAKIPLFYQKF